MGYKFSTMRAKLIYIVQRDDDGELAPGTAWDALEVIQLLWRKQCRDGERDARKFRNRLHNLQSHANKDLAETLYEIKRNEDNILQFLHRSKTL